MRTDRAVALWTAVVGGVAFVALAAWLVPWDPVPGGPLEPVPATDILTPAQIERAEEYSYWARWWSYGSLFVGLAFLCWLGFTRHGRRLVERLPGPWWVQVLLAVAVVEVLQRLVTLPFAVLLRRHRLDYGLSTQSWGGFALDLVKSEALTIVVTGAVLVAVFALSRRWPRAWPALAGALLGGLVLVGSYVYPVLVEPLFNDFESLPEGELRSEVFALAEEQGVELEDVLVVDASRRTTTLNAYVSGFGDTRRVVLYDTLIEDLPRNQALSVVAHELAHAGSRDVVMGSVLGASAVVVGSALLALCALLGSSGSGLYRLHGNTTPRLIALLTIGLLLTAPVENGIARLIETRADVNALKAMDDPDAFVAVHQRLAQRSLVDPTPPRLAWLWFASHPPATQRVALARRWGRGFS